MRQLAQRLGTSLEDPWATPSPDSEAGRWCARVGRALAREPAAPSWNGTLPVDVGRTPKGTATTKAALGRALPDLTREAPETTRRVVTVSPDVSSTTNLGGWVNKVGVWSGANEANRNWFADDPETPAALERVAVGPAHRARHSRGEPCVPHRRARRHLVTLGRAAATDRRDVRPVRAPGTRTMDLRLLHRRTIHPGRHAVGRDAGP